jgi:hypothetical protein
LVNTHAFNLDFTTPRLTIWQIFSAFFLALLFIFSIYAQESLSKNAGKELVKAQQGEDVYRYNKNVLVEKGVKAKSVLAFGGDIIIEGEVEEDVATIGGTINQKETAFIGGDVIVFGGTYLHEKKEPWRNKDKQSVVFAVFEDELRDVVENPIQLFAPQFSLAFFAQRLLSMLFWFVISLAFTTIAPGAISRSVTRFQLSTLKVIGIGLLAFLTTSLVVTAILSFMPTSLSIIIALMISTLLLLSMVYGRVTVQVSLGKWIQKRFWSANQSSESMSIFIGTLVLTILTSIPYIWTLAVIFLFAASLGLVLTARSINNWQRK